MLGNFFLQKINPFFSFFNLDDAKEKTRLEAEAKAKAGVNIKQNIQGYSETANEISKTILAEAEAKAKTDAKEKARLEAKATEAEAKTVAEEKTKFRLRCGFTNKRKFDKGFEILDANKDGLITENELKAYFVNQNYGNMG